MNIGIVIRHCQREQSSNYLIELLPYLTKKHNIDIFTGIHDEIQNKRVKFHKIPVFFSNFFLQEFAFGLISTIIMMKQNFDITWSQPTRYLTPDISHMEFCYAGWIEYKRKIGLPLETQDRFLTFIENYNLKKSKKIIATSEGIKKEIMKFYNIPEEKIRVIPNGINVNFFTPDKKLKQIIKKKYGYSDDEFILLFIGRNLRRKGLEYLIKSLPLIKKKNFRLLVCGGVDDYHKNLVQKLGQSRRVTFVGEVEKYKIKEHYLMSDIFVFPTFYEGFPFVMLEASASGLPIIATKANGTEDLIENEVNGLLLENRDPKKIADAINMLISNEKLMDEMGKKAREVAVKKYSWSIIAKQILEIIDETADLKNP
jgi:UDP-glucose:(heptosyl)LPS alpha-1,3-glucosyltransferase